MPSSAVTSKTSSFAFRRIRMTVGSLQPNASAISVVKTAASLPLMCFTKCSASLRRWTIAAASKRRNLKLEFANEVAFGKI